MGNSVTKVISDVKTGVAGVIDDAKNSKVWGFIKKFGGYILAVVSIMTIVILALASSARYAVGGCPEVMAVDKSRVTEVLEQCEKKSRGEFFLKIYELGIVPDSFTIYEVLDYREKGFTVNTAREEKKELKKPGFFKRILN